MRTAFAQLCGIAAMGLFVMAVDWLNYGYGLNPLIALPLATALLYLPYTRLQDWF